MGTLDEVVEIDSLERGLLSGTGTRGENGAEGETVLYAASFQEMEDKFIKYQTSQWVLYSLLLVLAWGIGFFMLLYLPVRRYILRKDIQSKKLYLTPNSIVYRVKSSVPALNLRKHISTKLLLTKSCVYFLSLSDAYVHLVQVTRPVPFPCFGVLKKEKHILLPSVADIVIEQGYLQSLFGVYSLRIENIGVRRPPSDDVQIQGVANPSAFRKAVLMRLSSMRSEAFSRQVSAIEDVPNSRVSQSKSVTQDSFSHTGDLILLQKLEEVGTSVKRVQSLIEEQHPQRTEHRE